MLKMTSQEKVACHREKLDGFLRRENIFPASIELDITTQCSRGCHECPSTTRPAHEHLSLKFLDRLFEAMQRQTKGLLLSGGEPTLAPNFSGVLALARRRGLEEIAVVTNGSHLNVSPVMDALAENASVVRISLYDWDKELQWGAKGIFRKIEKLRLYFDQQNSPCKIGVSALTETSRIPQLRFLCDAAKTAGADWIYFHPLCAGWDTADLNREDQTGVREEMEALRKDAANGFGIHFCLQRYAYEPLTFDAYHTSQFLLVIGADGKNYLGTEVKYQPRYMLADLSGGNWRDDFLWQPSRMAMIKHYHHDNYPPQGGRHRAVLYNHFLQQILDGRIDLAKKNIQPEEYLFPHVL